MPRVSVILINWNGLEMTSRALSSLQREAAGVDYEVLVVDNGSRDGSPQELPRRFPRIELLSNESNEGFARACNRATRRARGDYLLFLNNDTVQVEDALARALDYLERHPEVALLGITHLDAESHGFQPSAFRFPRASHDVLGLLGLGWLVPASESYDPDTTQDVDWVCGSFFMVRRSAWELVGEFDERFFVYDEDIDWCLRARQRGAVVRYWPGARIVHLGAASAPSLRDKTFMHFRSRQTFYAKHAGWLASSAFYCALSARLTASSLVQVTKLLMGRAGTADVGERLRRLFCFVTLRSTRAGLKTP